MTIAAGTVAALIAFVIGLAGGQQMESRKKMAIPAPLTAAEATHLRAAITEHGLATAIKDLRRERPEMSLRQARAAAALLQ